MLPIGEICVDVDLNRWNANEGEIIVLELMLLA